MQGPESISPMEALRNNPNFFEELVRGAYSLGSDGIGVQLHTVNYAHNTLPGDALPRWAFAAYADSSSNYIRDAYVQGWLHPESADITPHYLSEYDDQHRALITEMNAKYESLDWRITRNALDTLLGVTSENEMAPITDEELEVYLRRAHDLNLLERFSKDDIRSIDDIVSQIKADTTVYGKYSPQNIRNRLTRSKVGFSRQVNNLANSLMLSVTYRDAMLQAATYKLGTMLAITYQIFYDAYMSKRQISADYIPVDGLDNKHVTWKAMLGEDIPTIEQLILQARGVFEKYADPKDPILSSLLGIDLTQYLKKE